MPTPQQFENRVRQIIRDAGSLLDHSAALTTTPDETERLALGIHLKDVSQELYSTADWVRLEARDMYNAELAIWQDAGCPDGPED